MSYLPSKSNNICHDVSFFIQIKQEVDYLLGIKLYLHPIDCVKGRRPATGQSDISTVYFPIDNQPSAFI